MLLEMLSYVDGEALDLLKIDFGSRGGGMVTADVRYHFRHYRAEVIDEALVTTLDFRATTCWGGCYRGRSRGGGGEEMSADWAMICESFPFKASTVGDAEDVNATFMAKVKYVIDPGTSLIMRVSTRDRIGGMESLSDVAGSVDEVVVVTP